MSVGIAVMAKVPCAGRSKTRLVPMLSPGEAAAMSGAFLRDITGNLARVAMDGAVVPYVAYAPAGAAEAVREYLAPGTGLLLADGSGDAPAGVQGFGRCLLDAIRAMLDQGHDAACVLNADSPTLPPRLLHEAAACLTGPGDGAVMGPAEDGGYYLLGMRRAHAGLLANIDWSTDQVAAQTRARAAAMGLSLTELPVWYDVDEPSELERLIGELAGGACGERYHAPHTAACVARLGLAARFSTGPAHRAAFQNASGAARVGA